MATLDLTSVNVNGYMFKIKCQIDKIVHFQLSTFAYLYLFFNRNEREEKRRESRSHTHETF